jgi:thiol peroxidase
MEKIMATVTFEGTPFETVGELPKIGASAPDFTIIKADLSEAKLSDYAGKKLVLNIFPSIDTPVCATSVRKFNEKAVALNNSAVLCVSADLPFAAGRFCGAEGIENVDTGSVYQKACSFGSDYGVAFAEGSVLTDYLSRSIIVLDENGKVIYTEQVGETVDEPNYDAALEALK